MILFALTLFLSCLSSLESLKFDSKNELLPPKESCGFQLSGGGLPRQGAAPDDYPWMVFIPLAHRIPVPGANLRCAGTLISKRYFIMSKYCLQYYMNTVYIGQYDTSQNVTCGASGCRPVVEVKVEKWIGDELEIALVRLERDIEFSEYVQPICLPFEDFPKAQPGETVYSSGWGRTYPGGDYTQMKKKIKESLITNEECEESGVISEAENERFICTKVQLNDVTNIPCYGDDGAPIMYRTSDNQWVLQGILPWLSSCAIEEPAAGARFNEETFEFIFKHMYE